LSTTFFIFFIFYNPLSFAATDSILPLLYLYVKHFFKIIHVWFINFQTRYNLQLSGVGVDW